MAYTIQYSGGTFTIADGTLNIGNTSLQLPGRNYAGYGQPVDQDLVYILENFASADGSNGPSNPILGQLWFSNSSGNTSSLGALKVYYGQGNALGWKTIATNDSNSTVSFKQVNTSLLYPSNTTATANVSAPASTGQLVGNWIVPPGSSFTIQTSGNGNSTVNFLGSTLEANIINAGNANQTGYLTGQWNITPGSSITLNGNAAFIDARQGNLLSTTLSTGASNVNGNLTGNWTVTAGSKINLLNSYLYLHPLDANGVPVAGSNSIVDVRTTGTGDFFYANTINAGSSTANATLTGNWTVDGPQFSMSPNVTTANFLGSGNVALFLNRNISAGTYANGAPNPAVNGTMTGNWAFSTGSVLDMRSAVVYAPVLNAGTSTSSVGTMTGNWTVNNDLTISGNMVTSTLKAIGNSTSSGGTITGNWTLTSGSQLNATYADLGERFAADTFYEAGTVVELGGDAEVTAVREDLSDNVFGVVSNTAGYIMNGMAGAPETHPVIAMTGRVLVKVKGTVKKGERLVSAGAGYARAAKEGEVLPKRIVGRALENKTTEENGTVLAAVSVNI